MAVPPVLGLSAFGLIWSALAAASTDKTRAWLRAHAPAIRAAAGVTAGVTVAGVLLAVARVTAGETAAAGEACAGREERDVGDILGASSAETAAGVTAGGVTVAGVTAVDESPAAVDDAAAEAELEALLEHSLHLSALAKRAPRTASFEEGAGEGAGRQERVGQAEQEGAVRTLFTYPVLLQFYYDLLPHLIHLLTQGHSPLLLFMIDDY
ncbi:hypothetical protein T492DRAFT_109030 [Pavlovales sp. CCMP2436]|nr:hypothetical protein T492DRAFT_109030 [Pavlovales sp. CCMP2436]